MKNSAKKVPTFKTKGRNQNKVFSNQVQNADAANTGADLQVSEVWISVSEGRNLLQVSDRAIRKNCRSGKYKAKTVSENGGKQYRIALSSLPMAARVNYYSTISKRPDSCAKTTGPVTPKALAKHSFLRAYEQFGKAAPYGQRERAKLDFLNAYESGGLPDVYRVLGEVKYKTAEKWFKKWKDAGRTPDVLADRYKPHTSSSVTKDQATVLIKCLLSPNQPPISEAIRTARKQMQMHGISWAQSDATFRRFLQGWIIKNQDLYNGTRYGAKAVNDYSLPSVFRNRDRIEVGDVLVADGHTLNFELINPLTGKAIRMTLILFYDMKSGMPLGFELMPTENTAAIAAALRRAILTLGFTPRYVYLDNGRAFRAKYFTATKDFKTSELDGLFARLGIKTTFAWAYHGQSKTVERFFGAIAELERRVTSYTGRNIDTKPPRMQRNEKAHREAYQRITGGSAPSIAQFLDQLKNWVAEYITRPHQDGFYKGLAPLEIYKASLPVVRGLDDFKSRLVSESELNFLMMKAEYKTVGKNGVRFNNAWYWSEALYGLREKVLIRYDLWNDSRLLVFDVKERLICEAVKEDYVHPMAKLGDEADRELLARMIGRSQALRKMTMDQSKALLSEIEEDSPADNEKLADVTPPAKITNPKTKEDKSAQMAALYAEFEEEKEPIFLTEYERDKYYEKKKITA